MREVRLADSWLEMVEKKLYPGYSIVRYKKSPWTPVGQRLSESRIALVTTAAVHHLHDRPFDPGAGQWKESYKKVGFAEPGDYRYHTLWNSDPTGELTVTVSDYDSSDARRDINCVFPIDRLRELDQQGIVGSVAPRSFSFYGLLPDTDALQKSTAREVAVSLRDDRVDAVLLTPGGPLSHQSLAVIQRTIEAYGIPTVSITLAKDMTEAVCVPRAVYLNFPMGNPVGEPFFVRQQTAVVESALRSLYSIEKPGTVLPLALSWRSQATLQK